MIQNLNARKKEILDQQERMLQSASEAKVQLTAVENETFENLTKELDSVNSNITRYAAIEKNRSEVSTPVNQVVLPTFGEKTKYSNCTAEYATAFWKSLSTRNFSNSALGEGGTAADGSFLVPSMTDPTIPALAVIEASARKLSRVITTEMDIKLPYQASKTVAAAKAESNSGGTNAFATNVPTFATTTLTANMAGDSVAVSWELLQDVKALSQFLTADLNRAVFNYEENMFINGTGTGQPLGYLNGATPFATEGLNIDNILDLVAGLRAAYYANANFLFSGGGCFLVSEFSGLAFTGVDGTVGNFWPNGTSNPSVGFTTSNSGDLVLGYVVSNNGVGTGSGFTGTGFSNGVTAQMEWLQQTSAGGVTVNWIASNDTNFKGIVAAGFYGTASAPAVVHLLGMCGCGG